MTDEQPITDKLPIDEQESISTPTPLDEMTQLRDALSEQLTAYQALLTELRGLLTTPTPPPTAIGNPAQTPPLNLDEVRGMDVQTVKRRLDEVLNSLRNRG